VEKTKIKETQKTSGLQLLPRINHWVRSNRIESLVFATVLLVSAFLRLYKIDDYMTFLGDEGRDAIIVRNLLVHADPILIGPGTSIGNMYLGPHYYYLIAPFLFLANFSPVGPSVMVALFGIATVFLVWYVTREWFGKLGAIIASILYATAPVVIIYSRSSWNPNVMPFFSLVSIYSMWRVYKFKEFNWLLVAGISLALALNSHYLALLLIPVAGVYWLLTYLKISKAWPTSLVNKWKVVPKNKSEVHNLLKKSLFGLLIFLVMMSPLAVFDARHNWINFSAIKTFFTVRQETVSIKPWSSLNKVIPLSEKITTRLVAATVPNAGKAAFYSLLFIAVLLFFKERKNLKNVWLDSPYLVILVWLGVSLLGLSQYKQEIYDHYYGFFFPAPFILIGALSEGILRKYRWALGPLFLLGVFYLLFINVANSPLKYPPNRQLARSEAVAKEIELWSAGREFNFTVIAERNYEGAYQYFFERDGVPIKVIDPQKYDETLTDQLFVVCELPKEKCDPTHNPKAGIANFGWSRIESHKEVEGVQIFRLVHAEQ
jgi:4-amino-4-deoxy-L-arabinose transferase-like glycosyltransferase